MTEREVGIFAAKQAGEYLLSVFGSDHDIRYKSDTSPVTEADMHSSELIERVIKESFPEHSVLSEETPGALETSIGMEPTWIIDPLDGTSNFIAKIPLFAVIIALVIEQKTVLGIIFDPVHNDLFVAEDGKGTTLNGVITHVSTKEHIRGAMLLAGRGYRDSDHQRHGEIIYALEQETTYFRRFGCAAMMLASVASGRADSVIMTGNTPWDVAAGALLITEAGGKITDYCGNPWGLESKDLVATNGILHNELISITCTIETAL